MANSDPRMLTLLESVRQLTADLEGQGGEHEQAVATRLRSSVLRPVEQVAQQPASAVTGDADKRAKSPADAGLDAIAAADLSAGLDAQVWDLTRTATRLRLEFPDEIALTEATAGLQDLAMRGVDEPAAAERLAELLVLQAGMAEEVRVVGNGPYLATNPRCIHDHLGVRLATRPTMALCRCGASGIKPTCDGACAVMGFTDEKDPKRVADRRDAYVGQQVTVLDNRGTCQHSGYCTDRLATVFHLGEEPFAHPSGGRMDEIIRAVRDCPSGALSYALDTVEARSQVDFAGQREPAIEISKDGPYRITGDMPLVDGDGQDVDRNVGASREHYALCRCGHSQNKPFCSGMHWHVDFRDPEPDPYRTPTMFEWCGGLPALTRMTRLFYEKYVPADPMLGPIFANMSADHPQRVAKWLGEVFGGPPRYSDEYGGYPRMISEHVGKCLTEEWRAQWVALMTRSAHEAGLPNDPEFRSAFGAYLEWGSRLAVENSQTDSRPPPNMPMPHWTWDTGAGPPGGRISALAPPAEDEVDVVLPAGDEPVRFDKHIKGLFRSSDRQSMNFAFDLWSYEDVRNHAAAILERLRAGTMPCDGPWPQEKTDVFSRWVDAGTPA